MMNPRFVPFEALRAVRAMSELDDAFLAAERLDSNDRLRLIAQLWASLPAEHWAAPSEGDLAEIEYLLVNRDTAKMAAE
jgi:hypothetical protein